MRKRKLFVASVVCSAVVFAIALTTHNIQTVKAAPVCKGVICHATGSATNPFVGIEVGVGNTDSCSSYPVSNNGHVDENGSPTSGHEEDRYLGVGAEKSDCDKASEPPK